MLEPLFYFHSYIIPNVFIHVYYVHNENLPLKSKTLITLTCFLAVIAFQAIFSDQ